MFSFRKPADKLVRAFVEGQARLDFTYRSVGATVSTWPAGYQHDHARFPLGSGQQVFKKAKAALQCWKQFDLGWAHAQPDDTSIEPTRTVAVVFHMLGIWFLNSAKIVYVVDEPNRFGFAYGTLPGHVECGEERFLVECDADGTVWYDVRAFSRPRHILTKIGYLYVRWLQKRFVRKSAEAMRRVTSGE
jgi:uncharacterized protein (UPF0548 family)